VEMLQTQPNWQLEQAETESFVATLSNMMTGLVVAGLFTNVVLGLLLGRAWQAGLYNPGGFAEEFQQIQLGKVPAIITILMAAIALISGAGFAIIQNCLPILLVLFSVQGVAVVHCVVRMQQKHKGWLVVMYVLLLVMMPQMVFLLAVVGVLEQWFNFRRRSVERGE
ncbi:MAG: Na+-transporting NADH:ubiquinone oxidoreductase subunit NqrB, partial [Methylophagaceae bacterium]